ncbi:MAG: MotA/TolQ/ExbB proton channel family protein [Methyloversatilis sp.]|jgi:biopolymer transport protein ExbB|nr:MotA/TolQ/ExbB proton channel family protein [Methyloversatilis sp.]
MTRSLLLCCLLSLLAHATHAADAAQQARTLDELLEQVAQERSAEEARQREREARFVAERDRQARLTQQARAELQQLRARAAALDAEYEAGERRLAEMQVRIGKLGSSLGELQNGVRQFAADMRPLLSQSATRLQHADGLAALDRMLEPQRLIGAADIEALWHLLLQEMRDTGSTVRLNTPVVEASGRRQARDVVRVGPFTVIDGDGFLHYDATLNALDRPARQPGGGMQDIARDFYRHGDGGLQPMVIDPTRGELLALLSQVPTLTERIHQGGTIGYIIIALGGIALLYAALRGLQLAGTERRIERQLADPQPRADNPLGRVLAVHESAGDTDTETLRLKLDEAVLRELPQMERGLPMLALVAAMAPMLGLLGTVTGMIRTFQAITLFGAGDPRLMSGGISEALVTTVLGLVTAIPLLLAHSALSGRAERLVHVIDQQSAGLLARRVERDGGDRHEAA